MAHQEQVVLSDYIKSIHSNLRHNASIMGGEAAWNQHCKDKAALRKYAKAMKELACNFWDVNSARDHAKAMSRVKWIVSYTEKYYLSGLFKECRAKEKGIALKIDLELTELKSYWDCGQKLKLLDVGSCYNPFKQFEMFEVTPIDIAPASEDVIECDFLNLNLGKEPFASNTYHVIVFSLFLEYLPTPEHRISCCEKAYELLKPEGILFVITPDSKHVGANAKIMKSWRFLLAQMGFSRIRYEKLPHLHCMAFRKSLQEEIAQRWAQLRSKEDFYEEMIIPQDLQRNRLKEEDCPSFNESGSVQESQESTNEMFEELPFSVF